ncbi:hypothetical protein ACFL4V_02300 [Candidatus Latescibacterota bacterium]
MLKKNIMYKIFSLLPFPFFITVFLLSSFNSENLSAQPTDLTSTQEDALCIFLDRMGHYEEYIIQEISYVNFVRDRKQAHVHILMTGQKTGSGGTEYTITFTGLQEYYAMDDTLVYASKQMDSEEMVRSGILNTLKLGLVRYVSRTPLADQIIISYQEKQNLKRKAPEEVVDKWDYWVFNINESGRWSGEKTRKNLVINSSISADRVTPNWKMNFFIGSNDNKQEIYTSDGWYTNYTQTRNFRSFIVKSLNSHWSVGFHFHPQTSVYQNIKLRLEVAPAIEYNVFPYSESTYRDFTFAYRVDYTDNLYDEETIFFKTHEKLLDESLAARYQIKEKWGSIEISMQGSHYFHDISKNRLNMRCNLNLRLFEGLSLDVTGSMSRIHDQLSIPRENLSDEEILLNRRQQGTDYSYNMSLGFRYTFGSIYSNVVNPRFDVVNIAGR